MKMYIYVFVNKKVFYSKTFFQFLFLKIYNNFFQSVHNVFYSSSPKLLRLATVPSTLGALLSSLDRLFTAGMELSVELSIELAVELSGINARSA